MQEEEASTGQGAHSRSPSDFIYLPTLPQRRESQRGQTLGVRVAQTWASFFDEKKAGGEESEVTILIFSLEIDGRGGGEMAQW